ncbi:TonB-dependent receptor [Cellulophaga sp. 20_2_10]|uniref:TonB-dependent receptor plug domain-containing protein n=1 Tax=Cellulophaga sp. 20_2_10 TaxID=2942476 RepID=UPI00201AEB4F|nr:TonB-dependent receptor [Cellulophaga sp. 20_2_10]MCL5246409.1 TonB-dependent receptor [Cellulophaga sp. 20_2_10]
MILNKQHLSICFMLFLSASAFSQELKKDSIKLNKLEEVVVTGQYNPQSIKKSVHNVIVINREQIENQAANNLADVLNFNLNLTVVPNGQTGKSTISFFGLDAQYFNILVDNIPLVSDSGLGNNIDLTQINLDDVERIEIVEGAMGVEYGANAVSGVINIITKKSSDSDWSVQAILQEETISDEYAWFNKGKHIQGLNIGHNINDNWYTRVGVNRNQFSGFYNGKQGENYYKNDGLRGFDWLPKTQINTNALLNYTKNNFTLFYKFDCLNEVVNYYDAAVRANIDTQSQTSNPSATDRIFTTNRFVNNLSINGSLNSGANYKASVSYQEQKRRLNEFNNFIITDQRSNETDEVYQSSSVFFSKGSINNLIKSDFYNFQLGYEARFIKGFDTQASGDVTAQDKEQSQSNYALFGSSEVTISDKIILRPGLRYEYNSTFNSKLLGSLSARYLMKNGFELRANLGNSYRTPNFEELYYYLVDSNHDVRGNEKLKPESGFTSFLNLKKRSWIKDVSLLNTIKVTYIDVKDKIDLAIVNQTPLQYQYINVNEYKLWGVTSENSLKTDNWTFNIGATLQGISQVANDEVNSEDKFLYSFQLNTSSTYQIKKWNTAVTLLLKHTGEQQNYSATGTDASGNPTFSKTTTGAYNWLDASLKKSFLDKSFQVTLGARNLLDVTTVDVIRPTSGGVHSSSGNGILLGYGRSYYLKLLYNLKF